MQQNQPWTEERIRTELRRCAREIAEMETQDPPGRAVLVTLGIEDWTREMRLILDTLPMTSWPYKLVSSPAWAEKIGWPCCVEASTDTIACVTFPDEMTVVVPWGALQLRSAVVQ